MEPAVLALLIPLSAIGLGWWATYLKHKEKMAGVGRYGQGEGNLRQTVQLLTETLERQHDRQQALVKRLEALEAIVTHERLPEPPEPIAIPDPEHVPTSAGRTAGRTAA
jgi:hypothetical protein